MAQAKVLTMQPPVPCDGYPDPRPYYPKDLSVDEVSWYFRALETDDPKVTEVFHNIVFTTKIACTMFYHPHATATKEDCLIPLDKKRPVVIVCHGYNSWRNQMFIVNLAGSIAQELQCHTLRFDFTGCGHSTRDWDGAQYEAELNDVRSVVDFVQKDLGLRVAAIVGHQKATIAVNRYMVEENLKATAENKPTSIPCVIGLAGLFMTPETPDKFILDWFALTEEQQAELEKEGSFRYPNDEEIVGNRRKQVFTKEALQTRVDMNCVKDMTKSWLLSIYGGEDNVVPKKSGKSYASVAPNSEKRIVENASHDFNGTKYMTEISAMICEFITKHGGC